MPDQDPIELKRVQSLLESMDGCTDTKVCARLAAISNEALGMLNSFEDAVAHLLLVCPVAAKVFKKLRAHRYKETAQKGYEENDGTCHGNIRSQASPPRAY